MLGLFAAFAFAAAAADLAFARTDRERYEGASSAAMNEPVERCKAAWAALSTEAALVDESLALSEVHAVALMVSMLRAMVLQVPARSYAVLLCLIALSQAYMCCCRLCRRVPS